MFERVKIEQGKRRRFLSDFFLAAGILCLAVVLICLARYRDQNREEAVTVVISQDGVRTSYPLFEPRTIRIEGKEGYNVVEIGEKGVFVSEADCPDQICVQEGIKSGGSDVIICLPHKLIISLEGAQEESLDAMTN